MSAKSDVAVVLLNYNGKNELEQFLPSVVANSTDASVYIIDNASTDDSKTFVSDKYPKIRWIQLNENYGYAGGYNKGLAELTNKYFVLLNTDVEVTENWLGPVLQVFENDVQCAVAMPKVLSYHNRNIFEHAGAAGGFLDGLGYPYCRGRIFYTLEEDKGQYNGITDCDWASGAALFIKSEQFRGIGGFDEAYFMHQEEIDLCWRLRRQGFTVKYVSDSTVYHVGGAGLSYNSPKKVFLNFRNNYMACYKNWSIVESLWKWPVRLIMDGVAFWRFVFTGNMKNAAAMVKAMFHFIMLKPATFRKRTRSKVKLKYKPLSVAWKYFIQSKSTFEQVR